MSKLLKLKILITTVLLSYSINLLANNIQHSSTGEVVNLNDSVLIAYDDLRLVNSKLIELEYEKQINANLKKIISNDSIIIKEQLNINNNLKKNYRKNIRKRNIITGISITITAITTIVSIMK